MCSVNENARQEQGRGLGQHMGLRQAAKSFFFLKNRGLEYFIASNKANML